MTDPVVTITASAIATLAFQKAIESGAGELAKKFTEAAIKKMDDLRQLIWERLQGKHEKADEALPKAAMGDKQAIDTVAKLLDVEMLDPNFATQVLAMVQEINAGKLEDNSSMTQIIQDNARGWQTKVIGDGTNIGEFHYYGTSKADQK